MSTLRTAALPAALAGLLLAAGCGEQLPSPGPAVGSAEKALADGLSWEKSGTLQDAVRCFGEAIRQADAVMVRLVPGDEHLARAQKVRAEAAAGLGRVTEEMRRRELRGAAGEQAAPARGEERENLLPPVLADQPPVVKPPDPPKDPGTGTTVPGPGPGPGPGETPKPPDQPKEPDKPKEPEKPKDVHVSKVLVKDGKTVVIYWRFTNLTENAVRLGAPIGHLLNKTGGQVSTFRQHFLANDFKLNAEDPLASRGTVVTPDSVQLGKGESRELVTVGSTTQARQAGGASISVSMGDGTEFKDSLNEVVTE